MFMPAFRPLRARRPTLAVRTGVMLLALLPMLALPAVSRAQQPEPPAVSSDGTPLYHGNHCGWGTRGRNLPPVDALDAACLRHDRCWARVGQNSCVCDNALAAEAAAVAADESLDTELRDRAVTVGALFRILPCN